MTAVTSVVRQVVLGRAGALCERCEGSLDGPWGMSLHHRHPRSMGGTRRAWVNEPANLLALCGSGTSPDGCHQWVESHRREAVEQGLLLRSGSDPITTPYMTAEGCWWLLNDDGERHRITLPFIHPQPGGHH